MREGGNFDKALRFKIVEFKRGVELNFFEKIICPYMAVITRFREISIKFYLFFSPKEITKKRRD